ncbi:MAG: hypothetical protein U0559_05365 [Anaerolineae bacterium]
MLYWRIRHFRWFAGQQTPGFATKIGKPLFDPQFNLYDVMPPCPIGRTAPSSITKACP